MAVTVDYRCRSCGWAAERRVASPPPAASPVAPVGGRPIACGPPSASWAGLASRRAAPPPPGGPDCLAHRDIPGLCTLSPTAARSLVARVRGDSRALDRELAYQERMQREAPGVLTVGGHAPAHHHEDESTTRRSP